VNFLISPDPSRSEALRIDYADGYDGITYVNGGVLQVRTKEIQADGVGNPVTVDAPWTIDGLDGSPAGILQLANAALGTEGATINGSILTGSAVIVKGTLRAMGTDNEIFSKHLTLEPGGAIELEGIAYQDLSAPGTPTVTDPGQLSMPFGGVTYSGGTITGAGVIHHEGPILVNGDVSAEVSTFDFDGQQTTLGNQINIQGGRLQVKAAALQDGTNIDLVSSDFEINNGALLVSRVADPLAAGPPSDYLAWKLKSFSEIELTGNAVISASDDFNHLAKFGSEMQVAGLVKASGSGNTIYAPTRVLQGGQIVAENDQLEIAGNTTVAAGGVVQANAGGGIRFSKPLFLEGGGTLWADGRVLLEGGTYLQGGTLEGNAAIRSDSDLFVEQPSTSNVKYLDLDGANEAQTLRLQADFTVNAESIEYSWTNINDPITAELPKFDGSIDVNAPATLTMNIGNASAGDIWILDGAVWVDANLDDGVGEGKGLNIAGSPFQFCNTSIHIGAGSWLNIDADASGIFQPVQGGGEMKFNANWSPGKSPAALSFAGDLGFGPDARVIMEIYRSLEADGSDPFGQLYGTDPFDSFEVAGLIDLGGATLEVIFQDGFQPVAGQSFPLFSASSILGSFSTIIPRGLPQGLMLDASGLSGGFLSVAVSPEPTAVLLLLLGLALLPRRRRR
jgi:MYXO-CTERM domain-containing protein